MSTNNNEIINQIKDSLEIADIIGDTVKLRRTHKGFMGLCPFHQEDTPSFHVYTESQTYYCFGCHASGDIFTYIEKTQNLTFPEALRVLADRAGIKLETHRQESPNTRDVLDLAAKFFTGTLRGAQGTVARAYMKRRQLDEPDIAKFSLGYSPSSWDGLTQFLRKQGFKDKAIIDAGLAIPNSKGIYDRFRGRLIFPIRDVTGRVIAFGGRLIDGEGAKYINSPESSSYSKRRNLYLLDTARKSMREKGRSILVEGYMDAVRLHKCGFTEAVASLGTSLTQDQAKILSRYADRCYICYDSDKAGQAAAIKGMYILAENGLSVYVVSVPEGKDPDDFLCSNPPEKFEGALNDAKPLILQHIEYLKPALSDRMRRRSAVKELFEELRRLSVDDVLEHMGSICDATMLTPDVVRSFLLENKSPEVKHSAPSPQKPKPSELIPDSEAAMCFLLRNSGECRLKLAPEEASQLLSTDIARSTAYALLTEDPEAQELLWRNLGDEDRISLLNRGSILCSQMGKLSDSEKFRDVYTALKQGSIQREIAEISAKPPHEQDTKRLMELYSQRGLYSR